MKRIVSVIIFFMVVMHVFPLCAFAAETTETIEYLADGSYIVTTVTESVTRANSTKTASKTDRYYNADDELQWLMVVTGTFTYDGSTSECTSVRGSTSIVESGKWYIISDSPTKSGPTATYTVTFGYRALGITIDRPTHSVSLTCDANGNLS